MKITLQEIRKLIQEQLLQEQAFGKLAFVYHASNSPPDDMYDFIKNKSFDPGLGDGSAAVGPGLYTIREINPKSPTFNGRYGQYVYKFKANLGGVISEDPELTKLIYGKNLSIFDQLKYIIDNNLVSKQKIQKLKEFLKFNIQKPKDKPYDYHNSELFGDEDSNNKYFSYERVLMSYVKGIGYTSGIHGKEITFYSLDGIVPVAWTKIGKNKAKEDYKWQPFKIGSQSQSYDYKNFDDENYYEEIADFSKYNLKFDKMLYLAKTTSNPTVLQKINNYREALNKINDYEEYVSHHEMDDLNVTLIRNLNCPKEILIKIAESSYDNQTIQEATEALKDRFNYEI